MFERVYQGGDELLSPRPVLNPQVLSTKTLQNKDRALATTSKNLCQSCLDLLLNIWNGYVELDDPTGFHSIDNGVSDRDFKEKFHHSSVADLKVAAQSCYICRTLFQEMSFRFREEEKWPPRSLSSTSYFRWLSSKLGERSDLQFLLRFRLPNLLESDFGINFTATLAKDDSFFVNAKESLSAFSPDFAWILRSIKDCQHKHEQCEVLSAGAGKFVPTRLLDVFSSESNQTQVVHTQRRLCGQRISYTTLSHCWAGATFLTLRTDTMGLLSENAFSTSILPQTFQDAIKVTRNLGLRYIWIDSLCVIQDDLKDWEQESKNMLDVYANCYVNIAATSAKDPLHGFLKPRDLELTNPCLVQVEFKRQPTGKFLLYEEDSFERRIGLSCLNTRAWVVQERLVSPRTLHFDSEQTFFECREKVACERFPYGMPQNLPSTLYKNIEGLTSALNGPYRFWNRQVQYYSDRRLTFPQDKLVAIAGIAALVETKVRDVYFAGIWRSRMPADLEWKVLNLKREGGKDERVIACRSSYYVSPSWSWASMDGLIQYSAPMEVLNQYNDGFRQNVAEVVSISVQNDPPNNKFGKVGGGEAQLKSFLLDINQDPSLFSDRQYWSFLWTSVAGNICLCSFWHDDPPVSCPKWLFLTTNSGYGTVNGLLVEETGQLGYYRRTGFASVHIFETVSRRAKTHSALRDLVKDEESLYAKLAEGHSKKQIILI